MIPEILPYPKLLNIREVEELKDRFCYVIEKYPLEGYVLLVYRSEGDVTIRVADWGSNKLEPDEDNTRYINNIVTIMSTIKLQQALYYFSDGKLVDVRISLNKFCGPGFIKDVFGQAKIPIQNDINKPLVINDDFKVSSHNNTIIKPSSFKSIVRDDVLLPMYGVIENETE
jgi:hypothetical protein